MFSQSARVGRAVLCGALLMACSDGGPPTQPAQGRTVSAGSKKASADVAVVTQATATVLYACYVPKKGSVYRIKTVDTPAECERGDVEFSWTDHGSGPISGVEFHSAAVTIPTGDRLFVACVEGKSVMNFGYEATGSSTTSQIRGSRPTLVSGGQSRWVFVAPAGTTWAFYWNCADMDPVTAAP